MKNVAYITPEQIACRYKPGARVELAALNSTPAPTCRVGTVSGTSNGNIYIKLDDGTSITAVYGIDYITVVPEIARARRRR